MKFFLSVSSFRSNFDAKRIPKLGNKVTRDRPWRISSKNWTRYGFIRKKTSFRVLRHD